MGKGLADLSGQRIAEFFCCITAFACLQRSPQARGKVRVEGKTITKGEKICQWMVVIAQPEDQEQCEHIDEIMGFEREKVVHQQAIAERRTLVAYSEDRMIGYLRYGFLWVGELPLIQMIRVAPEGRRRGVGKALVLSLEQYLRQQHLFLLLSSTDDINKNSLIFHQSLGLWPTFGE